MSTYPLTCLNGELVRSDAARVPVADRGFRFGDGVFETIRVEAGVPYQWEAHLARLADGLNVLRIPALEVDWRKLARKVLLSAPERDGFLRIAVSRGVGSQGYLPSPDALPTYVIEWLPPSLAPSAPARLWQSSITRPPLSALPGNHKLAHGISSTLALLEARDHGCDEALVLSHDGKLCEAAAANLFWVKGDVICTAALSTACLAGTTRSAIMSRAAVTEVTVKLDALTDADACFLSNARVGLWPVAELLPIGLKFNTTHQHILDIAEALKIERTLYITAHAQDWA